MSQIRLDLSDLFPIYIWIEDAQEGVVLENAREELKVEISDQKASALGRGGSMTHLHCVSAHHDSLII